ncbi:MAG: metallophosphoesterase [Chloroflexota bacterium]|nr:metallophosphoesterase [Chloroflexota bacterium]
MTDRIRVTWPDPEPFRARDGRPIRILAISDEPDPSLDSAATRDGLGEIDVIVGAGDLQPEYLSFVTDAFHAPLRYVRGNHDVGAAWAHTERALLPQPMPDATVVEEDGLRIIGFSGSPKYSDRGMERSAAGMWSLSILGWLRARRRRPVLVVSHAPPRDVNDDQDRAHRGFTAFRWLAQRLAPPLWLHGHTALVRRGIDDRTEQLGDTLFYNCTGATLVELVPPAD